MAASMFVLGIFCALAFRIAVRKAAFKSGSGPPSLAAIVIFFASRGNVRDILSQRFSFAALRCANLSCLLHLWPESFAFICQVLIIFKIFLRARGLTHPSFIFVVPGESQQRLH